MIQSGVGIFGGVRRMIEISNNLVDFGHNVVWFTPGGVECPWMDCKFPFKNLPLAKGRSWDVLVSNRASGEVISMVTSTKANKKLFYILGLGETRLKEFEQVLMHNAPTDDKQLKSLRYIMQHPDVELVANSTWQAEWLWSLGVECGLAVGAVNHSMFFPVKEVLTKRPSTFVIGTSGDPRTRKGTPVVEAAFEIILRKYPDAVLRKYHGLNLPQSEMAGWYSGNHVFLDGQLWAGWNNPVAESMACGVPVVCTKIGGNKDFCFDDETAYLVPRNNPEHMARAALRLLDNEFERDRLATAGLEVIRKFTWPECARQLEALF